MQEKNVAPEQAERWVIKSEKNLSQEMIAVYFSLNGETMDSSRQDDAGRSRPWSDVVACNRVAYELARNALLALPEFGDGKDMQLCALDNEATPAGDSEDPCEEALFGLFALSNRPVPAQRVRSIVKAVKASYAQAAKECDMDVVYHYTNRVVSYQGTDTLRLPV